MRGDVESKGPQVARGFLQILSGDDDYRFESGDSGSQELARRIVDSENRSLGRMNRNRLTAEMLRDTLLFASEELEPGDGLSLELSGPENRRRPVLGRVSRKQLDSYLALFDYPDPNVHSGKRAETSTPMQKLFVLNSPFMRQRSQALAERLLPEGHRSQENRVQRTYALLYGRPAESREVDLALDYLGDSPEVSESKWGDYAQALTLTNELMYLD